MTNFFTDYRVAYNHAVMEARNSNREMRYKTRPSALGAIWKGNSFSRPTPSL